MMMVIKWFIIVMMMDFDGDFNGELMDFNDD